MRTMITKFLLVAAVAALAIAGATTDSFAAKKKAAKKAASCTPIAMCGANCANGWCQRMWCGADGKWYAGLPCFEPFCGPKC